MKISNAERETLVKSFRDNIGASLRVRTSKGQRRTAGDPAPRDDENYSITKYLRGAILGQWPDSDAEQRLFKALGQDTGARGGFFVPPQLSNEVIEYLRAEAVVRNMPGVRVVPLTGTDKLQINRIGSAPSITWSGEADTLTDDTGLGFEQVTLELKKATCIYKISRELLDNAGPEVDGIVREEIGKEMALEEDRVILRGTGGKQPLGIYYQPGVNSTDLSATPDYDDFKSAVYQVENANAEVTGWVAHPRTKDTLARLKDGNGRYILNEQNLIGSPGVTSKAVTSLLGIPLSKTTAGITVGCWPDSGGAETFVVGGKWDQLLIGERPGLRIETSAERYFDTDQIALKVVKWVGYVLRHPLAFVVIKGIQA